MLHHRNRTVRWCRERWSRTLQFLGTALLVVGLAACGTSAQGSEQPAANTSPITAAATPSIPSASPSASPSSTPSASPTAGGVTGTVAVGAQGGAAWVVTASEFRSTTDQGAHWSSTPLPAGFTANLGIAASIGPNGALWLLSASGNTASFYQAAGPGNPWSRTTISVTWPTQTQVPSSPEFVAPGRDVAVFGSSAPGIITAVVTEGNTGLARVMLLSTDSGKTFAQHNPPTLHGDWHPAFISATSGVIEGNGVFVNGTPTVEPGAIYATTDGGASWKPMTLPSDSRPDVSLLGAPLVNGSHIYLTANMPTDDGWRLALYSGDNGQSFTVQGSVTVSKANSNAAPLVGVDGSNVWMVTGPATGSSTIFESSDGGANWKAVPAPALTPEFATVGIGLHGNAATIWQSMSNCPGSKSTCAPVAVLSATTDSAQHWHQVAVPSPS